MAPFFPDDEIIDNIPKLKFMHLFQPFVLFCFSHSSRLESLRQVVQTGQMLSWAQRAENSGFVDQHELGQVTLFRGEIGRRVKLLKF